MKSPRAQLEADYVIVGAGSAGCVLANRLSADPCNTVVLIEAGGDDRPHRNLPQAYANLHIQLPAGFTRVMKHPDLNWGYSSEPEPGIDGRRMPIPRGKVLGGSSSINGLLYVRGLPSDYDAWRQQGCVGWGYEDVLPYFRRSQHQQRGEDAFHGVGGPLSVVDPPLEHVMSDAVIDALAQAGVPRVADLNGPEQEGATFGQLTLKGGLRQSTAVAYLHPLMRRRNLTVITRAACEKVLLKEGRASGVRVRRGAESATVHARREVILCGGAINTPQLLQLSGIGPGAMLSAMGVPVQVDNPGVGANLQDHYAVMTRSRLKPGAPSLNAMSRGLGLAGQLLQCALHRRGLITAGGSHVTAFARSRPELDLPDIQFFSSPATADIPRSLKAGRMIMEREPGVTIGGYRMRPLSRGSVSLASPDPNEAPKVLHNYLTQPGDQQTAIAGLRLGRRIFAQPAIARYLDHEMAPGKAQQSDEELLAFARRAGSTAYHEAGSCAMGDRQDSPVDVRLRVNGVRGLRVVDASVMLAIVSGNTNAATIIIAEKGSEMILADAG